MLSKMSNYISSYFIKKGVIEEEERETYNYCFEISLSTILNSIIILILSISFRLYFEGLIFSVTFMMFRGACGGAHAKTHLGCLITLLLIFSGLILCIKFVPVYILCYVSIGLTASSYIIILFLCPVDNKNKPLNNAEKSQLKNKAIYYILIFVIPAILFLVFKLYKLSMSLSYAIFFASVSLIIGKIINHYDKKNEVILRERDD